MSYIYVILLSVTQSVFSEKEVIDLSNYSVCRRSLGKIGQLANRTSSHVSGPIKKIIKPRRLSVVARKFYAINR